MTLSMIREDTRLTPTTQYLSLNLVLLLFKLLSMLNVVVGLILLVIGYLWIGSYFAFCGVLYLLADRWRTKRRYFTARWFRVPRNLDLSERLLYINWSQFRWANALFILPISVFFIGTKNFWLWFLGIGLCLTLTMPAPSAALSLVKFYYDWHFRIVLFRRNSSDIAMAHKSVIMPACGLYGQVLLITDENLSAFQEGPMKRLSQWWLSEMYHPLVVADNRDHWRQVVMIELTFADFVVLDWSGEVTDNMRWELEQALLVCPPHRILLVVSAKSDLDRPENLAIRDAAKGLTMAPSPEDTMTRLLFLRALKTAMRRLCEEPRDKRLLARAAHLADKIDLKDIDWEAFESCSLPAAQSSAAVTRSLS
jgi:hypothetical protein